MHMIIREMFQKPIDRDIKGVIKVGQGDDANIRQELEEYVVTSQLAGHFAEFFANYKESINGSTDKIGVWISGFFGSGKSHFLKILSYLLENKTVQLPSPAGAASPRAVRALDYFIDGNKISDAATLADMKLCADMAPHTDVMLFNIDSKSGQSAAGHKDAIVSVFLKVFNEMQGYYGARPHLADLERELNDTGRYDEYKACFKETFGNEWEASRHRFKFIQDSIVKTLCKMEIMSETAARNWCEKASGSYDISIEAFAKQVADYIDKKGGGHRVVFLADEMGQYIGDDSRLMLNLQTITEDLGTACKGKAWVVVTSQQDIDAIARDMGLRSNDFSKIQGRFDTRLSLTSANVGEVIKKRILAKNETAAQTLRLLYEQKETIIKNLIIFNDSAEKKLYSGDADFTTIYPFVPYQFNLLASVLTSIRQHGASGKHLSEGERSMLALFQESAIRIMARDAGAIIPFNIFYDALHRFLDHSHAGVIIRAMENEIINPDKAEDCFAVEVLKTLFMVKYVNEIEANADNIVSLLVNNLDEDRIDLKTKVDDALRVLAGQKLVQRNGDIYVFLTDEEQEINREIESQNIEISDVTAKISELVYEDIFKDRRYRCPAHNGRYTFAFNQFVDEHPHRSNQSHDIGVHILTPNADYKDETTLRMMSGQGKEALAVLPNDRVFFDELRESMKIEKYLKTPPSAMLTKHAQIRAEKSDEMRRRAEAAKLFLVDALKNAEIYVNGDKAQIGAKDVPARLNEALGRLVSTVYHKLPYIETVFAETDIRKLFAKPNQQGADYSRSDPDDGTKKPNSHALADVLAYISHNTSSHAKTSMKTLLDRFQRAPYGFLESDIEWLVAKLFCDGEVAFAVSGAPVTLTNRTADEIIRYITKREFAERLLMERRERANANQKKAARELMRELFGASGTSDDDDAIMQLFQKRSGERLQMIEKYETISQGIPYPGKAILETGKSLLRKIAQIQNSFEFFDAVAAGRGAFLDFAEDFAQVKAFYDGEQKKIFDDALRQMRIYDDSKTFIVDEAVERCSAEIKAILKMPMPYGSIHKLPGLVKQFIDAYMAVLDGMSKPIFDAIEDARIRVAEELKSKTYIYEMSPRVNALFAELKDKADRCNNVAVFQNIRVEADALKMRLLNEIAKKDEAIAAAARDAVTENNVGYNGQPPQPKPPRVKSVSIKTINVGGTWQVKTKSDIDAHIDQLRHRLYAEMEEDTVLNIEF